ncbi:MAG: hypothetical protein ABI539_13240, partial [Acidobacteriota bacterium]
MTKIGGVLFSARRILFVFAVAAVFFTVTASAQTTEFTYQGNLKNGGVDANGSYDFEFGLYTALSGGFQLGSTQSVAAVTVTDGVFTVKLDFGNQYSSGSPRFLEIRVRQTGGGGFVTLSPRQQISSTPFAVKSLLSDTAATASTANSATTATTATNSLQLGGVAASQYVLTGDARLSDARAPLANSPNYVQNTTTQQSANFNVNGNGTVGGTLSANTINTSTQLNIGGIRFVSRGSIPSGFNTFVGEESGTVNLGTANAFYGSFSGQANLGGANNAFFGYSSGNTNTSGSNNAFFGRQSGEANTSGNNNSFFGRGSGNVNMTGSYNSFFGHTAGLQNTSGTNNTAIGSSTDFALPNLVFATAIGSFARAETDNTVVLGKKAGIYDGIARPADKVIIPGVLNVVGQLLALLPANDPSYIQNGSTLQGTATFNIDGDGRVGGILTGNSVNSLTQYNLNGSRILGNNGANNLFAGVGAGSNTTGGSNAFFGASSGSATTTGLGNSFFGMGSGAANTTGSNNTLVGNAANLGAGNLTFATAIGAGSQALVNNSVVLGRSADQVQIPGSLAVSGPLTGTFTIPTANLTGIVSIANGGTGLGAVGGAGTFLRSNGSIWQAATLVAGDVPSGSTHYIQNSNSPQASSNFNISGDGTAGGTLSANIVNSTTQYRIAGDRILSVNGASNVFLGSGTATTGSSNTFVGTQAGGANSTGTGNAFFGTTSGSGTTTGTSNSFFGNGTGIANILGSNNTAIGAGANMGANNLTFATAVGAGAVVGSNNTVTLGRAADTVQIPGNLSVAGNSGVVGNLSITGTLTAGTFSLPATSITGILPISKGGTGQTAVGSNGTFLRSDG